MNQAQRDEIYRLSGPRARAYIDLLEKMGSAAIKFYLAKSSEQHPTESQEELCQAFVKLGWLDEDENNPFYIVPQLRVGACVHCERSDVYLNDAGYCKGCVLEGMM